MKQIKKAGKIRRKLLTVLCCISLLTADLAVMPAWALEPDAEQTRNFEKESGTAGGIVEEEQSSAGAEDVSEEQPAEDGRRRTHRGCKRRRRR